MIPPPLKLGRTGNREPGDSGGEMERFKQRLDPRFLAGPSANRRSSQRLNPRSCHNLGLDIFTAAPPYDSRLGVSLSFIRICRLRSQRTPNMSIVARNALLPKLYLLTPVWRLRWFTGISTILYPGRLPIRTALLRSTFGENGTTPLNRCEQARSKISCAPKCKRRV